MELAELIEAAWTEYLKSIDPVPWNKDIGNGESLRIFPGQNDTGKDGAYIRCYVEDLGDEEPPLSGNRTTEVVIELVTPVVEADQSALDAHKENASALELAVLDVELPDKLTEAIDGFTCFGIVNRTPFREQDEFAWHSGYRVKCHCCPSAIPD